MAGKWKIYLRVTGHYQGVLKGKETVSRDGEGDGWFEISSFRFPRQANPVKNINGGWDFKDGDLLITKTLDTLAFAKAQAIGEPLDKIEIAIVGTDPGGVEQTYQQWTVTDALIAGRTTGWDSANRTSMESISIKFLGAELEQLESDLSSPNPDRPFYDLAASKKM